MSAWRMRSLETTAPTVDSELCSAMGPSAASSATRISPSLPTDGRMPAIAGDADGLGDAPAAAEADGRGLRWETATGPGMPMPAATRMRPVTSRGPELPWRPRPSAGRCRGRCGRGGRAERRGARRRCDRRGRYGGRARAPADAEGPAVGAIVGGGVGEGGGAARVASRVRISMKPSPVWVTLASTPCAMKTSLTACGVTVVVLEPDRPDRAAGEVDGELQPDLAAGEGAEEDEDQAGDRDRQGEREEPVALPDNVEPVDPALAVRHARAPLPEGRCGRWLGRARNSSSVTP